MYSYPIVLNHVSHFHTEQRLFANNNVLTESLPLYRVESFEYMSLVKDTLINPFTRHENIQHQILQECHYLKGATIKGKSLFQLSNLYVISSRPIKLNQLNRVC